MDGRRRSLSCRQLPCAFALLLGLGACGEESPPRVALVDVPAPLLADSLVPNPASLPALVVLPPGYHGSVRTYPVVYYLPGFTTDVTEYVDRSLDGFHLGEALDDLVRRAAVRELVVVVVSGRNALGGSFYVNSPVTGRWEDHVLAEVVPFVEARYRVCREAPCRGVAGDSMGGFGALHLAMRHPATFGAVFAISPGLFDEHGLDESGMLSDASVAAWLWQERRLRLWPRSEAPERMVALARELYAADGRFAYRRGFTLAYAAAFAPRPEAGPPFADWPFRLEGGRVAGGDAARDRLERGFGGLTGKVRDHLDAWRSLRGIGLDAGRHDRMAWVPRGTRRLAALLAEQGIAAELTEHDGGHVDRLGERIAGVMLPFFSRVLAAPGRVGGGGADRGHGDD